MNVKGLDRGFLIGDKNFQTLTKLLCSAKLLVEYPRSTSIEDFLIVSIRAIAYLSVHSSAVRELYTMVCYLLPYRGSPKSPLVIVLKTELFELAHIGKFIC
jgi:hypothetical protein